MAQIDSESSHAHCPCDCFHLPPITCSSSAGCHDLAEKSRCREVTLQRSFLTPPACVLPPCPAARPQPVGFHLRLAAGFGFELTHGHFAYVSSVGSVLPSSSAWETASREHRATAPCKSCGKGAPPITDNQGGEARLLRMLSDIIEK